MKLELKNIHHYPRMSEETACYEAALWIDGVKIGTVSNRGTGGGDDFCGDQRAYAEANRRAACLPPEVYGDREYPQTVESLCAKVLDDWIASKDFDKALKRAVLFKLGPAIMETAYKGRKPVDAALIEHVKAKHPTVTILNTLPRAEALAMYRGQA